MYNNPYYNPWQAMAANAAANAWGMVPQPGAQPYPGQPQPMPAQPMPAQPQPVQPQPVQTQPARKAEAPIQGFWIDDVRELDAYQVQPNVPLVGWLRNADVIVMRTVDEMGRIHERVIDYRERPDPNAVQIDPSRLATKDDLSQLSGEVESIRAQINAMRGGGSDAAV